MIGQRSTGAAIARAQQAIADRAEDVVTGAVLSAARKALFLRELAARPGVGLAARAAGIDSSQLYGARKADPWFRQLWDEALALHGDVLEQSAFERAVNGSDLLTIFLLKGMKREKYGEQVDRTSDKKAVINVNLIQVETTTPTNEIVQVIESQVLSTPERRDRETD